MYIEFHNYKNNKLILFVSSCKTFLITKIRFHLLKHYQRGKEIKGSNNRKSDSNLDNDSCRNNRKEMNFLIFPLWNEALLKAG